VSDTTRAVLSVIGMAVIGTLAVSPIFFALAWLVSKPYPVRREAVKQWLRRHR
jgi:hypothetical protein